jgi:hypothetical protein
LDERDINYVKAGESGVALLHGLMGTAIPFKASGVASVAETDSGHNSLRVEATLDKAPASLRPGMEGVAKIEVGRASYAWIWTRPRLAAHVHLDLGAIMAGGFFTQAWHRVAALKPRLASHVKATRHRYGAQSWYALADPLSGRVHRVTPNAYLFAVRLDGGGTVDEMRRELVGELEAEAPG